MNHITNVRIVDLIEAISAIVLFFVAMPLKYGAGYSQAVSVGGAVHGLLWVIYIAVVLAACFAGKLSGKWFVILVAASIIPFGPFFFDGRLKKMEKPATDQADHVG